jgi:hypothetical protein
MAEAFTAAFGITPAEWGRDWTASLYGDAARVGVLPRAGDWVVGLLYLAIGVLLAVRVVRSRRVA